MKFVLEDETGAELVVEGRQSGVQITVLAGTQIETLLSASQVVDLQFALNQARQAVKEKP